MRPCRLELEGFSAYRAPTVVDFEGVDLFALTGPTGSGKTAVLDAIAFALYGVIHRLGDRRAVEPAISQGLQECRVRFDFTVGGAAWTATRVVRRTKAGGATTAEARLEGPSGVVAGTADEVNARVEELLGLSYDHFTRCVVLPQGEFARFLQDKPRDRQELLISLLELDLYGRMASVAKRRSADAKGDVQRFDGQLEQLSQATDEAMTAAAARVEVLAALVAVLDAEVPELARLTVEQEAAAQQASALTAEADRLAAVTVPADVAGLATALAQAVTARSAAETATAEAERRELAARAAAEAAPDPAACQAALQAFDDRATAAARFEKGESVVAERRAAAAAAEAALAEADHRLLAARRAAELATVAHQAHAVRAELVVGEPCPVCEQVVPVLPTGEAPVDLSATRAAVDQAEQGRTAEERQRSAAVAELGKAEATLAAVREAIEALDRQLAGRDRAAVEAELAMARAAAAELATAVERASSCRAAERTARAAASAAVEAEATARHQFDAVRDQVAALGPPARVPGDDLVAAWEALAGWAAGEAPSRRAAAIEARATAQALASRRADLLQSLADRCAAAEVAVGQRESPRDAAAAAQARAAAAHELLVQQHAEAARVVAERQSAATRHEIAATLATQLDAGHFEKWLLDEAVRELADGATELLRTLSGGHYSLTVDAKGTFVVVDHHNADERRSARTLSGGETFLASLALALALADRIATLASGGAARLDAIFLDEGFGTLDPDTLDVVATAIEELGAAGRMVGVVSHVAELAERVPVRFEVARTGNASTITRVDR